MTTEANEFKLNLDYELSKRRDDLIRLRRDFHAHPELSFEEGRTAQIVGDRMEKLGYTVTRGVGRTGVVAVLAGGQPGNTVMWRADMDALPLQEDTARFDFHSENDGKMHACGHDGHTAIALTVADILAERKNDLPGRVVFAFQPAEEIGNGAKAMLDDGLFATTGPLGGKPDYALGLHLGAFSPTGTVTLKPGPLMAAADAFKFVVKGVGGHASMPHLSVDPILVGSQLVVALQTLVSREIDPMNPAVVSFGTFQSGTKSNIIPVEAVLTGSLRTLDPKLRSYILERMAAMGRDLGQLFRAEISFTLGEHAPAVINPADLTKFATRSATAVLGADAVLDNPAIMGSEDMSEFMMETPGCFMFVGAQRSDGPTPHHSPLFAIDEKSLDIGVKVATQTIVDFMQK